MLDCISHSSCHGLPWLLCLAIWLAGSVQSKFEPAKVLWSFRYAHLHATFTFRNVWVMTYYPSKLLENPSVTSGGYPQNHNILSFKAVENPVATSGGFIIIPHVILTPLSLSPSCKRRFHFKKDHAAYSMAAEDYDSASAHAIQDFKTSARSSHLPTWSSPVQDGILTLNSFIIPYPKLGAGGRGPICPNETG